MGKGKLGHETKVISNDEIGELAAAFNKLSVDLKKSQDELREYSENLEIIVTKRTEELEDKTSNLEKINKDLIKARKELDALNKTLEKRIKEKHAEFSGLVSMQGAAHLVARDLGVNILVKKRKFKISDMKDGMKNVDLIGRIISIFIIHP